MKPEESLLYTKKIKLKLIILRFDKINGWPLIRF